MESNGKSVTKAGSRVDYETGVRLTAFFDVALMLFSQSFGVKAGQTANTLSISSSTRVPSSFPGQCSSSLQLIEPVGPHVDWQKYSDFLAPVETLNPISGGKHHEILLSNFFAQPEWAQSRWSFISRSRWL